MIRPTWDEYFKKIVLVTSEDHLYDYKLDVC